MKTFSQKAILVALFSAVATPAMSTDMPTLFGQAHISFGSVSEDTGTRYSANSVASHASRIGIKGSIDTESDTKVIYSFVWEVDMTDNAKSSADNLKSRDQYVGLKNSWGELRVGRDDSPYKLAGKKNVEHLSDTWADFNNIIDKGQDTRNDDSIAYWNKIGPGKLGIAYAAGNDDPSLGALNVGQNSSIAYDIKIDNFGFAIATQTIKHSSTNDETGVKLSVGYKLGNTQLGLMYETVKDDLVLDNKNTYVSIKQKLSDANSLVVAYGIKDQGLANDATMTALSFQHALDKKVSVYALWADGADGGLNDASKLAGDGSAMVAGIIAKF
ncbi:MAG: porin [Gammaproteobacteria bacterium]|nr:porin [Gammaproteobacteria bacterium]